MSDFFEKLKKGMGIDESITIKEEVERIIEEPSSPKKKKAVKSPKKEKNFEEELKKPEEPLKEEVIIEEPKKIEVKENIEEDIFVSKLNEKEEELMEEGQLAIDVYQTEEDLVIQSAIAGVRPEELEIVIEKDMISIKGNRKKPTKEDGKYLFQECFWGPFSRELILPVEIDSSRAEATTKEGLLTIRAPKIQKEKKKVVIVKKI